MITRIENKVVVYFRDRRIVKGYTDDFNPNKEIFHVTLARNKREIVAVSTSQVKAVFFVKTFEGDKNHPGPADFSMEAFRHSPGLKVKVTFFDDEIIYGSTHAYSPQRKGFFIFPANKEINNDRVFVNRDSTVSVETWRWKKPYKATTYPKSPLADVTDSHAPSLD